MQGATVFLSLDPSDLDNAKSDETRDGQTKLLDSVACLPTFVMTFKPSCYITRAPQTSVEPDLDPVKYRVSCQPAASGNCVSLRLFVLNSLATPKLDCCCYCGLHCTSERDGETRRPFASTSHPATSTLRAPPAISSDYFDRGFARTRKTMDRPKQALHQQTISTSYSKRSIPGAGVMCPLLLSARDCPKRDGTITSPAFTSVRRSREVFFEVRN